MKIGIINHFPTDPNAEKVLNLRLERALEDLGYGVSYLSSTFTNKSSISSENNSDNIEDFLNPNVELIIDSHFEIPSFYNVSSLGLLLNPIEFYVNWGTVKHFTNQLTHNNLITSNSKQVEKFFAQFLDKNKLITDVYFYPSLNDILDFRNSQGRKLYYSGINWERYSGKGRHHELLSRLDKSNLIHIYGPKKLGNGVKPWKGYSNYLGESQTFGIDFLKNIQNAGIGLLLNSESHLEDDLFSNRLYEYIAAGVPIISTQSEFLKSKFGDGIFYVEKGMSTQENYLQIIHHMRFINDENNQEFIENRVRKNQSNYLTNFGIKENLSKAFHIINDDKVDKSLFYKELSVYVIVDKYNISEIEQSVVYLQKYFLEVIIIINNKYIDDFDFRSFKKNNVLKLYFYDNQIDWEHITSITSAKFLINLSCGEKLYTKSIPKINNMINSRLYQNIFGITGIRFPGDYSFNQSKPEAVNFISTPIEHCLPSNLIINKHFLTNYFAAHRSLFSNFTIIKNSEKMLNKSNLIFEPMFYVVGKDSYRFDLFEIDKVNHYKAKALNDFSKYFINADENPGPLEY